MKSRTTLKLILPCLVLALMGLGCGKSSLQPATSDVLAAEDSQVAMRSPMDAGRLASFKAALPNVGYPKLQQIFLSPQTYWYDHESVTPSYQAAVTEPMFVSSNADWLDPIAGSVKQTAENFFNEDKKLWRFPFSTTAGTDDSTNVKVLNFLSLPTKNGRLLPVVINKKPRTIDPTISLPSRSWGWIYPNETIIGEIIFSSAADGALLPIEVRIRTRYPSGWSVNAFRPFPTADSLAEALKKRGNTANSPQIEAMIKHLSDKSTLTAKTLRSETIPNVFDQTGSQDVLPHFDNPALVKELLTQTVFVSSYGTAWKISGDKAAYAATTTEALSIVPNHYTAGVIEVREASCVRCHKETGRGLTTFKQSFSNILLYGDMWGRDGIFSFHPFDESQYQFANFANTPDNRRLNPAMLEQGLIANFQSGTHGAPDYPLNEVGFGK